MSFILDALRKSETERQQQQSAEFASIATGRDSGSGPRWIWVVGVLLAVNIAVLVGFYLRQDVDTPRADVAPGTIETAVQNDIGTARPERSFAEKVATARDNGPPRFGTDDEASDERVLEIESATPKLVAERPRATLSSAAYPTIHTVRANGSITLPDLHLDIHVYSDVPKDRFVFINMSKYREGSQLDEGPVIHEITTDGVVLGHRGLFFLLPRD